MATKRYLVSLDDRTRTRAAEVAAVLESIGFEVDEVFDVIGVITGRLDERRVSEARALQGVGTIEEDGGVTTQEG
jgi:hypothetical protein